MFVYYASLSGRKKWFLWGIVGICTVFIIFLLIDGFCGRQSDRLVIEGRELSLTVEEESDLYRIADFFGIEVNAQSMKRENIRIPSRFNGVYWHYNDLAKKNGLNLKPYQGKNCVLYTWEIQPETGEEEELLHLLICDGRLIGGDRCGKEFGGTLREL